MPSITRFQIREALFLLLYAHDFSGSPAEESVVLIAEQLKVRPKDLQPAREWFARLLKKLDTLDQMIRAGSEEYEFERISSAERNLLRVAAFELMDDPGLPVEVIVSEASRLTKKFATEASINFVRAVLQKIAHGRKLGDEQISSEPVDS